MTAICGTKLLVDGQHRGVGEDVVGVLSLEAALLPGLAAWRISKWQRARMFLRRACEVPIAHVVCGISYHRLHGIQAPCRIELEGSCRDCMKWNHTMSQLEKRRSHRPASRKGAAARPTSGRRSGIRPLQLLQQARIL